ncbi:MAG: acetyl-coenzyme A synthetase N-terminal domain-containing protein [Rhodoblastus sp.]
MDNLLHETRVFQPPGHGPGPWHVASMEEYRLAAPAERVENPEVFWADEARRLAWFRGWDSVLEWKAPDAKWFVRRAAQRLLQLRGSARAGGPWRADGAGVGG